MKKAFIPIIVALSVVFGLLVGVALGTKKLEMNDNLNYYPTNENKISQLLNLIDGAYVDSIQSDSVVEAILPLILKQLDPHSSYIPAAELADANSQLEGSFSGIGVQFSIQDDTVDVVDVIAGSPSERAGLMAGDRIVEVNDTAFVGKSISNERVMKKLRGPKGSKVRLGIVRSTATEILHFEVERGDIPVRSVDVAYMVTPKIGYISVNKFGATTYNEFLTALAKLKKQKATKLIVDLRGNSGGYMDAAVNMLNEFLSNGDLIVYVEGSKYHRSDYNANGYGTCQDMQLVVLIDEFSGSASEIFSGAIQDNDRGIIIGRRSFGKGLVQNQFEFADGSAVRLTIARYYTPSGRCIQKPYVRGKADDYETDLLNRYLHGEFFSKDSIQQADTAVFYTKAGRVVHGGGGIMPDVFVPRDTLGVTPYFNKLVNGGHIYRFALQYTDKNRATLSQYKDWKLLVQYLDSQKLMTQFTTYAESKGVKGSASDKATSNELISHQINSYIIRNMLGDDGAFPYGNTFDKTVQRAVKELSK